MNFKLRPLSLLRSFWVLFLWGIIVLNSSYALMTVDDTPAILSLFFLTLILFSRALLKGVFKTVTPFTGTVVLFAVAHIITMIAKGEISTWGPYVRQLCLLVCAYCYVKTVPFNRFCEQYLLFLKVSCYASLILFISINALENTSFFPTYENVNYVTYYSMILAFAQKGSTYRCMGPFWEPGIFSSFLVLGIILETCYVKRPSRRHHILLFSVMTIMTFSTGGYLLLVITYLIVLNRKSTQKISALLNYAVLLLCFGLFFFFDDLITLLAMLIPSVFDKITWESVSMMTRLNNPIVDMIIWLEHPLIGAGIRNYQTEWARVSALYIIGSRTSTLTYYLATIGLGGCLYTWMVFRGISRQKQLSSVIRLAFLLIFVCILTKEPHYNNLLVLLFIMYLNTNKPVMPVYYERSKL